MAEELTIVYTPLNGTGNVPVRRILRELGFKKVYTVAEQAAPDGNFPTTARPNPEEPEAFALALALAREKRADLVLATDPDADRLGVYARDAVSGEYKSFTGNMSGVLILEYLLREKKKLGTLPADAFAAETIVTTDMAKAVAAEYGVRLFETLTGFKYIGEQIRLSEESGAGEFVFGLEESYGCLAGTYARDKDSIVAVMLLAEIAAFYKQQGKTLVDAMEELYRKYGYYREGMSSLTRKGADGAEEIRQRMEAMRSNPPETLAGVRVLAVRDYLAGTVRDLTTGEVRPTGLPKSNVLYYELEGGAWCCARPSGTEPKIKFYEGVVGKDAGDAERRLRELAAALAV
jgi:phosphoglucomutase